MSTTNGTGWLHRLRERGVIRVAASYALIAWLLLQIADVTFEPLGVPRWVMVSLIVAAVLGFPVAIALAWFYEAGDRGITRDTAAEGLPRPIVHGVRRYADIVIIGVLLAAVAVLLVRQSQLGPAAPRGTAIAVLPFENLSTAGEGEVLASGIAESVLHQLASLAELDVISRTSSFAFRGRATDAREIGRQLGARYLLEGAVQSDRRRMRVTTQLIDTETGSDVWSMRFDRRPGDIFEVQDEIAMQVTQALELSLDARTRDRLTGQGTSNVEAYLAFMQGRALLGNERVVDAKQAIEQFERAIKLDPKFAAGYVSLAEAELFVAEFDVTDDRQERFERALIRGQELVEQALALDTDNGDAYLERAHLLYFHDLAAAEADYRRGLELSPNSANGYAGLATVLYETPSRRDEALAMLERARKLDPLDPEYDVFKSVFLFYERADIPGTNNLLVDVLRDHPRYLPALLRLCELRSFAMGKVADGVMYCEQALAVDPLSAEARLHLIRDYLALDDVAAAEQVADDASGDSVVPEVLLQMHARDWVSAGEGAYEALERGTASPTVIVVMLDAILMHARSTGDTRRARIAIEQVAGVTWDAAGRPTWPDGSTGIVFAVLLAEAMLIDGEQELGRRLLADAIAKTNDEIRNQGRPEYWYMGTHARALALNGDREAAIALLQRSLKGRESNLLGDRYMVEAGRAYAPLLQDPRFQELLRVAREHIAAERRELDRMRREGLVPLRGSGERPSLRNAAALTKYIGTGGGLLRAMLLPPASDFDSAGSSRPDRARRARRVRRES
jgi:TolB-like protein